MRRSRMLITITAAALLASVATVPAVAEPPGQQRAAAKAEQIQALIGRVAPDQGAIERPTPTHQGGFARAGRDGSAIEVPGRADGTVTLSAPIDRIAATPGTTSGHASSRDRLGLTLPGKGGQNAQLTDDGTIVYPDERDGADIAVQLLDDDAVRVQTVTDGAQDPHHFAYRFDADVRLAERSDGGIDVLREHETAAVRIAVIDTPWARDADGAPVETSYEVDGNTLVQRIEPTDDAVYPIVADPKVTSTWWNRTVYFNRSETFHIQSATAAGAAAAALIPDPSLSKAVAAASGLTSAYVGWIYGQGDCLKVVHYLHQATGVPQKYGGSEAGWYCR